MPRKKFKTFRDVYAAIGCTARDMPVALGYDVGESRSGNVWYRQNFIPVWLWPDIQRACPAVKDADLIRMALAAPHIERHRAEWQT